MEDEGNLMLTNPQEERQEYNGDVDDGNNDYTNINTDQT